MEHISEVLPRALNGAGLVPSHVTSPAPRPTTLAELVPYLEAIESKDNPDVVVETRTLRVNPEGLLEIPMLGAFAPTDWSLSQIARFAGVKLNRWFENTDGETRADELNRRFARANSSVRLRTRRDVRPEGAPEGAAGTLRALVSPTYASISDARAAGGLMNALARSETDLRLLRLDLTSRTTTFVVKVGDTFTSRDRDTASVGEVWGAVLLRNSGVGFASLIATLELYRLLCTNGMFAPVPDALSVRRRHRGISDESLAKLLAAGLENIGHRLHRGHARLLASTRQQVKRVEDEVRDILNHADLPQRLARPILDAYAKEPSSTAFGVSQAITLAAQGMNAEDRVELEQLAGSYLSTFAET